MKQSDLRKIEYLKQYIGNKETFNDTIVNMANAMNSDSNDGVLFLTPLPSDMGAKELRKKMKRVPSGCRSGDCTIIIYFLTTRSTV